VITNKYVSLNLKKKISHQIMLNQVDICLVLLLCSPEQFMLNNLNKFEILKS